MDQLLSPLTNAGILPIDLLAILAAAALGAATRGFTGFGAAMILMPVLGATVGPMTAVPLMLVIDTSVTAPLVAAAVRKCHWREVLPLAAGAAVCLPIGIQFLTLADPYLLRWAMSIFVLAAVAVLASGWRYRKPVPLPATSAIGASAGFSSGLLGMSGPIIVLFWLAGQSNAALARANIIAYFGIAAVIGLVTYWLNDLLSARVLLLALLVIPVYALFLFLGTRLFRKASEKVFRRAALGVIALVAVGSLVA